MLHLSKAETKSVHHYAQLHSIFEYCPIMVLIQATFERGLDQWAQVMPTVRHIMHLTRHNHVVAVVSVVVASVVMVVVVVAAAAAAAVAASVVVVVERSSLN